MKKNVFLLSAITLGALCAAPHAAPQSTTPTTCPDCAPRNLLVSSYMDTALNPSSGEDTDFFIRAGGVPNIMFLVDTSRSMRRLPGNGPWLPGVSVAALPGVSLADPTDGAQQNTAYGSASRIVGCGDDAVSMLSPEFVNLATAIGARRFHPPCGSAQDATLRNAAYVGEDQPRTYGIVDYAAQMSVCPYWASGGTAVGKEGYDPDSYDGVNQATQKFFTKDLVFHDTVGGRSLLASVKFTGNVGTTFGHDFGDGWADSALAPWGSSIDDFCAGQGDATKISVCKTCLKNKGWYYDGIKLTDPNGGGEYPSLWYSGNYLNFFPPKFLVTKKIVKDVMSVQPRVRMAVVGLDDTGASVKANDNWLDLSPTCQMLDNDSEWASSRNSFNTKVGGLTFTNATKPLASALFDVGRFYHSPGLPWFGASWENTAKESDSNNNQFSVCFSCQASTVVLVTDGAPSSGDGSTLPTNATTTGDTSGKYAGNDTTGILGIGTSACPTCGTYTDYRDNLAKVAWYMHNMDLRDNAEQTKDCLTNGGKQALDVYTVGFGASNEAATILRNAAEAGGGIAVAASDPSELKTGMLSVLREINTRSTSFSVATVSTLQTTVGRSVIVPRFSPGKTAHWQGHLFRFDLYSEFVNACDPKPDGTGVGDYDCDGACTSVFLEDQRDLLSGGTYSTTPSFITEDGNGHFVRTDPARPACSVAPRCASITAKQCGNPGNADAVPFWDAGAWLASRSWKTRNVWTAVDSDHDGDVDAADGMLELTGATATAAAAVEAYMGLGGTGVCGQLGAKLRAKSWTSAATLVEGSKTVCARMILRYLLGADVLNEVGRTTYPPADPDSLEDRDYKLGDVFHSSPVVVEAPFPADGILCPNGLANQCLQSLWKTETKNGREAYDGYAKSSAFQYRSKLVLVGANDGLLHAFNGGQWLADTDDTYTDGVKENLPPFNGHYSRGDASEVWAFLPPDMIAKIPLLLGTEHRLFVDGSAMVRDVWVDNTNNGISGVGLTGPGSKDQKKQANEFHTVAVVGERRGGTHYFALDVTSATASGTSPKLLWIYPQPNERETLDFGETYDDFLPGAPPIGPVALKVADAAKIANVTPVMSVGVASPTAYEERWVAFLNGGFDPQYLRGRGVHMVDVWTGKELFDFSYPSDPSTLASDDPRLALRFPVAAVVGMTPWGTSAQRASGEKNAYLFDTATFGDTGGQMWVLRFHAPGELGADGKVTNWYGGRVFQMGGSGACKLCGGQPFFYMTANVPLPSNGAYRVFAGTGDRYNLLDTNGGTCGPDNIRACVLRGCTVTLPTSGNVLQTLDLGKAGRGFDHSSCSGSAPTFTASTPDDGTTTSDSAEGKAKIVITCGTGASAPATTKDVQVTCTKQADGYYGCTSPLTQPGTKLENLSTAISLGNWYLSLLVFEDGTARGIFTDLAGAKAYDAARLQLSQTSRTASTATTGLVTISASATNPTTLANATSKGWAIYYDHTSTGTTTVEDHVFNVSWMDERTSTGSAVLGDIFWNTVQPTTGQTTRAASTTGGCTVARCTQVDRRIGYHYGANLETGGLPQRLFDPTSGAVTRAITSTLLVPTQADQPTVFVNQKGQIAVGLTAVNPEKGASNVGMSDPIDPSMDLGWIEVSEPLHACRHPDTGVEPVCR